MGDNADLENDMKNSRIKQIINLEVCKTQIRQIKKREDNICGAYNKGSRRTQMPHQKSTCELQIKGLKI